MAPIIEAHGLTKRFKTTEALAGLDLVAERGQVTAVLGPNGAGKTTFIRMVATLLQPDAGTLTVAGIDALAEPAKVRRAIGLAGQSAAVEGAMTGRENLELIGRLFGHDPQQAKASARVVLERLGLADAGDRLARTYSGGMRRKLDLGASLVGAPELLLLDEPTTGLDPRSRNELWDAIRDLVASGTDVLLTTQYLDEADQLAARIAIIDHGKVIAEGTPDQLKSLGGRRRHPGPRHRPGRPRPGRRPPSPPSAPSRPASTSPPGRSPSPSPKARPSCWRRSGSSTPSGCRSADVGLRRPTLDEVFLKLTGRTAEADAEASPIAERPSGRKRRSRRHERRPPDPEETDR